MNELQPQQQTFNYFALDADIAIEARAAAERIKIRLRRTAEDIVEIGRELVEIKSKLTHGQFLPWVEAEFDMNEKAAQRFMQVFHRFGEIRHNVGFQPTVLYQLAAPSTPDEVVGKATEKAEAGDKVTVDDVKRWKAEAEQARQQAKELQICAMQNQQKAEQLRESLEAAQGKIDELNQQEPQTKIQFVTKEVLPADYESTKEELEAAKQEALKARNQLQAVRDRQAQEVKENTQAAIKFHEKELADMERKRDQAATRLDELQKHIAAMGEKAEACKFHQKIIDGWQHELIELSLIVTEFEYVEQTHDKWLKLAKNFHDASQAIEMIIAEKSGRCLDDRPDTSRNNTR